MFWFRRNERVGSWLALTALALQLIIAAFHFHTGAFASKAGHHAPVASALGLPGSDDPAAPAADTICGACVLIQLAASAVHPDVPALGAQPQTRWVAPATAVPELAQLLSSRAFNARAPPALWHLG